MATCHFCEQEMLVSVACSPRTVWIERIEYYRRAYRPDYKGPEGTCHDCNTPWGGLHHPGCDMEECPRCLGQAISCGCHWDDDEPENPEHPDARRAA